MSSEKLKIIVAGSRGRMGSLLVKLINDSKDLILAGEAEHDKPLKSVVDHGDVVIDFTVHHAAAKNATTAARHKKPIVIGTTGLSSEEEDEVKKAGKIVPIVYAPNMSVGINVMWKLVEIAARVLAPQFKVDIVETHHVKKLDRPSGTAKKILDIVLSHGGWKLDRDVFFYEEARPEPSKERPVSVCSVRRADVVGDHTVHFTSAGETVEITHHAFNREIFAQGALAAARWVVDKPAGLYTMADVLELRE